MRRVAVPSRGVRGRLRRRLEAAAPAGILAGAGMGLGMMLYMAATGRSVWTTPNLIAAMWMDEAVADGHLSVATAVGLATHMATSALMGVAAVPFIASLSLPRTLLAAVSYALASYPLVFATVMSWANPLMVERTELVPMTAAHALFGLILGWSYFKLGERVSGECAPGA